MKKTKIRENKEVVFDSEPYTIMFGLLVIKNYIYETI